MFLRLQRFPLGTPLYVRPRDIVAFAAYTDPNAVAVVVKGMDPAEAVWGTPEDLKHVLYVEDKMGPRDAQDSYDNRVKRLRAEIALAAKQKTSPQCGICAGPKKMHCQTCGGY